MMHDHNQNSINISKTANGYIVELYPKMKRFRRPKPFDTRVDLLAEIIVLARESNENKLNKEEIKSKLIEAKIQYEPDFTPDSENESKEEMERVFVFTNYSDVISFIREKEEYFNSEGSTIENGYGPAVLAR